MIGKRFTVGVADGRATYEVVAERLAALPTPGGGTETLMVRVRFVREDAYADDYISPVLGEETWIEAANVAAMIDRAERLAAMFGRRRRA